MVVLAERSRDNSLCSVTERQSVLRALPGVRECRYGWDDFAAAVGCLIGSRHSRLPRVPHRGDSPGPRCLCLSNDVPPSALHYSRGSPIKNASDRPDVFPLSNEVIPPIDCFPFPYRRLVTRHALDAKSRAWVPSTGWRRFPSSQLLNSRLLAPA